jgi:hypothetical protein
MPIFIEDLAQQEDTRKRRGELPQRVKELPYDLIDK